jgi:hypothetical protein
MRLAGTDGTFRFDVVGYQFPGAGPHADDDDWLNVSTAVEHPRGNWHAVDPCLTTRELESLANWLEDVAAGKPTRNGCYFTEPCLEFRLAHDSELAVCVTLAHECSPPWAQGRERVEGVVLHFPRAGNDFQEAALALREMVKRFPTRGGAA